MRVNFNGKSICTSPKLVKGNYNFAFGDQRSKVFKRNEFAKNMRTGNHVVLFQMSIFIYIEKTSVKLEKIQKYLSIFHLILHTS
jgi:hypothetical protein